MSLTRARIHDLVAKKVLVFLRVSQQNLKDLFEHEGLVRRTAAIQTGSANTTAFFATKSWFRAPASDECHWTS